MDVVIPGSDTSGHIINKYKFKVLAIGGQKQPVKHEKSDASFQTLYKEEEVAAQDVVEALDTQDSGEITTSGKDALIESLLKKADEMSSNFIKMQMKLEDKEAEMAKAVEEAKKTAYEEGIAAGRAQLEAELASKETQAAEQFANSVRTLEQKAAAFDVALEGIQSELLHAAVDMAKEVVLVEISENAQQIAVKLSQELVEELKDASKVTLKVNPEDHGPVSEKLGHLDHVEILSDSAVSCGGVIALSDIENIDAEILKRFERIKRAALSE